MSKRTYLLYPVMLAGLFIFINFLTRVALLTFPGLAPFSSGMAAGLCAGFLNDAATLPFVLLFPATMLLLPKTGFMRKTAGKIYTAAIFFLFSVIFTFTAFAEFFFWDEFSSRFNFIAVDYLIYTTELMHNAAESYPLPWLLTAVFIVSVAATFTLWKLLHRFSKNMTDEPSTIGGRLAALGGLYAAALLLFLFFTPVSANQNRFWNEYAKNGVYEIFSAYLHNQLDYRAFYKTMDQSEAFSLLRNGIPGVGTAFEAPRGNDVYPNVIIVVMESMGSRLFGELTPNLAALAAEGLSFSNMMSTGTRTVRGLEAIMLSIPPTPGNSIVRRPDNDHLFTLGTVFRNRGYDLSFIYGGIGFFDNMNAFFEKNGYDATDKLNFYPENKTFANAWGQCDEDLYAQSLAQADKSHAAGRLFQQVLLTTSNHRPFTYPDGRIPTASGAGRAGAVRYSDYAIGEFIRQAKTKPWFDNTVFVFIGDHPSSIAGKTEVPADAYGIVCILYGPRFFKSEKIDTLCSQIDLAPTLFAVLGWEYTSPFFGTDARVLPKNKGRAWISTYQILGFRTNDRLVILKPGSQVELTEIPPLFRENGVSAQPGETDSVMVSRAVASYQCAYDLFTTKQLKESAFPIYRR